MDYNGFYNKLSITGNNLSLFPSYSLSQFVIIPSFFFLFIYVLYLLPLLVRGNSTGLNKYIKQKITYIHYNRMHNMWYYYMFLIIYVIMIYHDFSEVRKTKSAKIQFWSPTFPINTGFFEFTPIKENIKEITRSRLSQVLKFLMHVACDVTSHSAYQPLIDTAW